MNRRETSVLVSWLILLVFVGVVAPSFFNRDHLISLAVSAAPVLVAAVGMTFVVLSRQIDISIGSQFCLCSIALALAAQHQAPVAVCALISLAVGGICGLINGWFVARLELPSIVVTLATMVLGRESLRWWREGEFVRNLPPSFQWFGLEQRFGQYVIIGIAATTILLGIWGLKWTAAGRAIYAVGCDQEAARLVGMRPQRVIHGAFVAMGMLTGLAAVLNSVRFRDIDPNSGLGLELQVIAAVVVGGVAVSGGRGTLLGAVLGVILLVSVSPILVFLRVKPEWEKGLQGLIILLAVMSDAWPGKRSVARSAS